MIDGIECFPYQKRKNNNKFKLWVLLLFSLLTIVVYYYFNTKEIQKKPRTTLIIIKDPENKPTKINSATQINTIKTKKVELLENLDEITLRK